MLITIFIKVTELNEAIKKETFIVHKRFRVIHKSILRSLGPTSNNNNKRVCFMFVLHEFVLHWLDMKKEREGVVTSTIFSVQTKIMFI